MNQDDIFETVVVSPGFGGKIIALSLANKIENDRIQYRI